MDVGGNVQLTRISEHLFMQCNEQNSDYVSQIFVPDIKKFCDVGTTYVRFCKPVSLYARTHLNSEILNI